MTMPFGKFKGVELCNVPDSYILWVRENCDFHDENLKDAVECEFESRFIRTEVVVEYRRVNLTPAELVWCKKLINAGYRALAKTNHPDVGGDAKKMRELIDAKTNLLGAIGE